MNTQLKPYVPAETIVITTPEEFVAVYREVAPQFAFFMRLFGLARVSATLEQLGMSGLLNVSFDKLTYPAGVLPKPLELSQKRVARWLAEGLQIFGLTSAEIAPTPTELGVIIDSWRRLTEAAADMRKQAEQQPATTLKLPPAGDPTNAPVLP